jgi:SSS family solute:Na+ symporter
MFFQYYSMLILFVCMAVMVAVSYATQPPDYDRITGLTFGTVSDEQRAASRGSWAAIDIVASGLVVAAILAAYLYFQG